MPDSGMARNEAVRPAPSFVVNVALAAMNILVLVLFVLLVISSYRHFLSSGTIRSFGVVAVSTLFLALFLARRPAQSETVSLPLWVLGIAGTALPLLLRPSDAPGVGHAGAALQIVGLVCLALALLSLRRSFAVVPANRGIRDGGLYRIVRHPVYLSELVVLLGVVVSNPTTANAAILVCECALQFARACAEERFLSADPAYRAYRERVRYRLIPGLI
jgi:protein-S-isoprenylcysteine O-methyltransferase Ste14